MKSAIKLAKSLKSNLTVNLYLIKNIWKQKKISRQRKAFNVFCTQIILTDSVYRKDENYYFKVFLEKCNIKNKIKIYFDDSYNVDSGNSDEKITTKKIQTKEIWMEKIECTKNTGELMGLHPKKLKITLFRKIKEIMVFQGLQVS